MPSYLAIAFIHILYNFRLAVMEGTNTDFSDSFSLPPSCAVLTIIPKVIFVIIELLLLGI